MPGGTAARRHYALGPRQVRHRGGDDRVDPARGPVEEVAPGGRMRQVVAAVGHLEFFQSIKTVFRPKQSMPLLFQNR